ncbi:DUF4381 domain-containing protein [Shimia sediminis]|uniref:DUF4381 domain-containing protein n=1 Tax=Shimia sediminis TaxID=2497945 RepID=UPI000F8E3065|nr:DUF4381 domain-containing protein [Shimia sediminis]
MTDLPQTEGLNLVEMLDLLEPIPEPPPISMIPATKGWIWLTLLILLAFAWALRSYLRHRQANAYRRAALAELDKARGDPARIAAILRRTALVAFARRDVAPLVGQDWLRFLNETCPGAAFTGEVGVALTEAPYRDNGSSSPDLVHQCRLWIRKHRPRSKA